METVVVSVLRLTFSFQACCYGEDRNNKGVTPAVSAPRRQEGKQDIFRKRKENAAATSNQK